MQRRFLSEDTACVSVYVHNMCECECEVFACVYTCTYVLYNKQKSKAHSGSSADYCTYHNNVVVVC